MPRDWNDVIQYTTQKLTNRPRCIQSIKHLFSNNNLFIYWGPSLFIFISALLNRKILYICWGVPKPSNTFMYRLKLHKLKVVLQHSDVVLVNDYQTYNEISHLIKNKLFIAPYIVDTDFYSMSLLQRDNFIVAPGDNDRNELLIRAIGEAGIKAYRITRTGKIAAYHRFSLNVSVKYKIPYSELRLLYQKATAVILPIHSLNHLAGQTSVLEALSCGTPVIISAGRTSTIFNNIGLVQTCSSNNVTDWLEKIDRARHLGINTELIKETRQYIERTNSFDSVCTFLINIIIENFGNNTA